MKRKMIHLPVWAALALALGSVQGCTGDEPAPPPAPPAEEVRRTVLVYMVADNNLGSAGFDQSDIDEMLEAARAGDIGSGRLLVYQAGYAAKPRLFEIENGTGDISELREYEREEGVYSVSSARMKEVFAAMKEEAPAEDYGLVLWSHATGWIQDGIREPEATPLSFGSDRGRTMNVTTLASVLEGEDFSFVYFDCCYMASVELAYELRNATPVIAGSATELVNTGMRYDLNIGEFFATGEADIIGAARNTYEYYDSQEGSRRTATMSVVRTAGLERLARAAREIYLRSEAGIPEGYTPQRFMDKSMDACYYFDLRDYVAALCAAEPFEGAEAALAEFDAAMKETVVYSAATPKLWNRVDLSRHNGLSTYILRDEASASTKNYNTLSWYADVASALFQQEQ